MKYKKIIGILIVLIALSMTIGNVVAEKFINCENTFIGSEDNNVSTIKSTKITIDAPEVVKDRNPFYIIGKLTDENGDSVANATLTVWINNEIPRIVSTDDNGQYTVYFAPKENGIVNVTVMFSSAVDYSGCTNRTSFSVDIPVDNDNIVSIDNNHIVKP